MKHVIKRRNKVRKIRNLCVILLCAGIEDRAKTQGSPALFDIDNSLLLDYQIDVLRKIFAKCRILPVVGFESEKVLASTHNEVEVVENQIYEETGTSESLRLALSATTSDNVLIIHGNTLFNQDVFVDVNFTHPFVLYSKKESDKVGVTENDGKLENMSYGLDKKWSNIFFSNKETTKKLKRKLIPNKYTNRLMHEEINDLLETNRIYAFEEFSETLEINNYKVQKNEINNIIKERSTPI